MYSAEQLEKIFARIGLAFDPSAKRDGKLLSDIQLAMVTHVPYENLDILSGVPLSLDYGDLYEKIVLRHRGGYCFEINGFFGETLRSLGYDVTEYMARYLRGETEIPMRRHRVIRAVGCDKKAWICDAGIGQPAFRLPLLMEEGYISEQYGETYKVVKEPFFGWVIYDLHHGEWRRFYGFTEEEQLNIDYVMPSFWCEHAPDSPFTKSPSLSIKTLTGRYTVDGGKFRVFDGESVDERDIGEDERGEIYERYFGLCVT